MIEIAVVTGPSTAAAARRVLLIEDDIDTRELVAAALRETGYEVEEAVDGRDGLAAILREAPTLVITDCNMPNLSGNELVETMALNARLRSIPVIVVSALKQPPLPANVIAFVEKPFTMEQLRVAVRDGLAELPVG